MDELKETEETRLRDDLHKIREQELEKLRKHPPAQNDKGGKIMSDLVYASYQLTDVKERMRENEQNVREHENLLRKAREQLARVQAHQEYWRDAVKRHS